MSVDQAQLDELRLICTGAEEHSESGYTYILLPELCLPSGAKMKALLCPQTHSGYLTRLFLEQPMAGQNFNEHVILGQKWYTWSWQGVASSLRLAQMLVQHVRGLC